MTSDGFILLAGTTAVGWNLNLWYKLISDSWGWSAEQPDYTLVARHTNHAASDWRSLEFYEQLRHNKRMQQKNLMLPAFINGTPPEQVYRHDRDPSTSSRTSSSSPRTHPSTTSKRVTACEYLIRGINQAILNGNKDFVAGSLHPKQRNKDLLKLDR